MRIALYTLAGIAAVATALPQAQECVGPQTFDASLVPEFGDVGIKPNPARPNECITAAGFAVDCACPGDRETFLNAVKDALSQPCPNSFGIPVEFPTDVSVPSRRNRIQTAITVLQNIKGGLGVGCPAFSTTFLEELKATYGA